MSSPLTSVGYKFETLSLLDQPWDATPRDKIESREELIVNNNAQYCSVVRTGIGSARLVIGGEVDAGMLKDKTRTKPSCSFRLLSDHLAVPSNLTC